MITIGQVAYTAQDEVARTRIIMKHDRAGGGKSHGERLRIKAGGQYARGANPEDFVIESTLGRFVHTTADIVKFPGGYYNSIFLLKVPHIKSYTAPARHGPCKLTTPLLQYYTTILVLSIPTESTTHQKLHSTCKNDGLSRCFRHCVCIRQNNTIKLLWHKKNWSACKQLRVVLVRPEDEASDAIQRFSRRHMSKPNAKVHSSFSSMRWRICLVVCYFPKGLNVEGYRERL